MSIALVEVRLGEDSIWELLEEAVFTSQDILTVSALDRFEEVRGEVRVEGRVLALPVFRSGPRSGYVRVRDLPG